MSSTARPAAAGNLDWTTIRASGIDPGTRNLAFCTIEWFGPPGTCSFKHFWEHLYIVDVEVVDIFEDCGLVCKSVKSAKPQKLIEATAHVMDRRKVALLTRPRPAKCHVIVRIEQQPTKNIRTKVLSAVMSSVLYLHACQGEEEESRASVDFQSASTKLNVMTTAAHAFEVLGDSTENVKLVGKFKRRRTKEQRKDSAKEYRVRKKEAVTKALEAINLMKPGTGVLKMRRLLLTTGKKDDASDSFLHAVYACQEKYQKVFAKRAPRKKPVAAVAAAAVADKPKVKKRKRVAAAASSSDDSDSEVIDLTGSVGKSSKKQAPKKPRKHIVQESSESEDSSDNSESEGDSSESD